MNDDAINRARKEAEQFLVAVRENANAEAANDGNASPKHSGALRRASMDLTRALAEMRRPG